MKTEFNEFLVDAKMNINTVGRSDRHSDKSKFPYEPTSYTVLDRLIKSGYITKDSCLIDYGCGKGRVPIYLHECLGCDTIGVEVETDFYKNAVSNLRSYLNACQKADEDTDASCIRIVHSKAQAYEVPEEVTHCFFFNPFSADILRNVMSRITGHTDRFGRSIYLFFYYPSSTYIDQLARNKQVSYIDSIDCTDLFAEDDGRNRILVYKTVPSHPDS